jgi:type II secretory pathway component GspD/PulD (secretin)
MKYASAFLAVTLAAIFGWAGAAAQTASTEAAARRVLTCPTSATTDSIRSFSLHNISQADDAHEVYTALRNMLPPDAKSYLVASQNTIFVCGTPEVFAVAQKLISDLDHPKKNYRLTYTVTEMEGGKRVGTQHFAMIIAAGQQATLKQGSKVPIATGSYQATASSATQTQFTYLDVGMNFSATLTDLGNAVSLQTNVEQSSVAEEKSGVGEQDPIVRQTSLKGASILTQGKPVMIGSVDVPGSTRHLDIEVMMEQLP